MTTLSGHALLSLSLVVPRLGAWTADVEADTDEPIEGVATLDVGGRIWRGGVVRGAVTFGRWSGRLVGAPGLQRDIPALSLADTTLRGVLDELLREAGESAAPAMDDLSAVVPRWHRIGASGAEAVADVARDAGKAWRVLPDGSVWVGSETWAALPLPADLDVMERDAIVGRFELAGDGALDVQPGRTVTLDGEAVRVGAVHHRLDGPTLRTDVLEEREDVTAGRLAAALESIVGRITRRSGRTGLYGARVVQQHDGSGSLDLQPDDPRLPSCQRVPYRTLPGLTVEIPAGSRVSFTYEDGDPRRPVVVLWEPSTVAGKWVVNGSSKRLARSDDTTANGKLIFGPTGTFVAYIAPGGVDVPTPPGGSVADLSGVVTGTSIIRG